MVNSVFYWIIFAQWFIDQRYLALLPPGTITKYRAKGHWMNIEWGITQIATLVTPIIDWLQKMKYSSDSYRWLIENQKCKELLLLRNFKVWWNSDSCSSQLRQLNVYKNWSIDPIATVVNSDSWLSENQNVASSGK